MLIAFAQRVYAVVFNGDKVLLGTFVLTSALLIFTFFVAYALQSGGFYAGIAIVSFGVAVGLLFLRGVPWQVCVPLISLFSVLHGAIYLFLLFCIRLKRRGIERRTQRAERARKVEFSLPDRENAFVRARLNTVLRTERQMDEQEIERAEDTESSTGAAVKLRFAHARKLLTKLKEAPLSTAERLEIEELTQLVGLYLQKTTLSGDDVRVVNEAFSRVLKLSAKYTI